MFYPTKPGSLELYQEAERKSRATKASSDHSVSYYSVAEPRPKIVYPKVGSIDETVSRAAPVRFRTRDSM